MPHYFESFSEEITNLTPNEHEWLAEYGGNLYDEDEDASLGCEFELTDQRLWLYSSPGDGASDLDQIAKMVQKFLAKFRPNDHWSLTYSDTCNQLLPGGFGGGAMFVTANEIKLWGTNAFLESCRSDSPTSPSN